MTRQELAELGLEHLIGTDLLRAYMHGYFMDNKLYERSKVVAKPSMYEEYQKEKNRQREEKRKEKRITMKQKKTGVNAELAEKWESGKKAVDERFSALFENGDYEIDKNSEEYRRAHASEMRGKKKAAVEEAEEEEKKGRGKWQIYRRQRALNPGDQCGHRHRGPGAHRRFPP